MRCPRCGADDDRVVDSRLVREGRAIRRRRECTACLERFTTYETSEARPVLVIKRDGRRVAYDRGKVIAGLAKACEKRPVPLAAIEAVVDAIEQDLAGGGAREVTSDAIGTAVLNRLRDLDEVAYVRFASVYRSFQDVEEFLAVLASLRAARRPAVARPTGHPPAGAGEAAPADRAAGTEPTVETRPASDPDSEARGGDRG